MVLKKIAFGLIFLSLTCMASEPKFHFKDCVKVTHGFYMGCEGTVETYEGDSTYEVSVSCKNGGSVFSVFTEKDLKLTTGCM